MADIEADAGPPPELPEDIPEDEKYLLLLTTPLSACAAYRPKFGQGGDGMSLDQFRAMYGADPFYSWIGLDSPLMYAAHKAAGGMTSVYRQLGIGSQWILNQVIQDHLGLTKAQANWSYQVPTDAGKVKTLSLDGRIQLDQVQDEGHRTRITDWLEEVCDKLYLPAATKETIKGVVIEARQGYKSKDSKRQNADITNAANAYAHLYVPVLLVFSTQIDGVLATRYTQAQWLILTGALEGDSMTSTYTFCREVVGYDLAAFFQRNSARIKADVEAILEKLISA